MRGRSKNVGGSLHISIGDKARRKKYAGLPSPDQVKNFFHDHPSKKKHLVANIFTLVMLTLESKVNNFSSASLFSCSCCFDFSYPLSPAQVSVDCAILGRQINRWKARNTNDKENFQV